MSLFLDPATHRISVIHEGRPVPVIDGATVRLPPGVSTLTWAFATGECGDETWGEASGQAIADANVRAFDRAGVRYIVSTGGAAASFTCGTDTGMEKFVARYWSPHLVGIDFDIERDQSDQAIASLVRRAREAQRRRPALRLSFTIATWAATDGSRRSLNATGEKVLRAIRSAGLRDYTLNLMVMNYGPADAASCVVAGGRCDMARSALQAAENVSRRYRVPFAQIALTPMLGVNDVLPNVFVPADAGVLARAARTLGLAGLHYWSLDRDRPCAGPPPVQSTCHGLPDAPALEFTRALHERR